MGESRWRRRAKRLTDWIMSAALVLALVILTVAPPGGAPLALGNVASALMESIGGLLRQAGSVLARLGRWGTANAVAMGDVATWITGFFTFAAFFVAWRVYRQGRDREMKGQANQVAAWAHLTARSAVEVRGSDGLYRIPNLRVTYAVVVANHSPAPIMGLRAVIRPYTPGEAARQHRDSNWHFRNNVLVWLKDSWRSGDKYPLKERLGPWVFKPGELASIHVTLRTELEFCEAKIYFWDAFGSGWSKDILTGALEPLHERLGLVDGDAPVVSTAQPNPVESRPAS